MQVIRHARPLRAARARAGNHFPRNCAERNGSRPRPSASDRASGPSRNELPPRRRPNGQLALLRQPTCTNPPNRPRPPFVSVSTYRASSTRLPRPRRSPVRVGAASASASEYVHVVVVGARYFLFSNFPRLLSFQTRKAFKLRRPPPLAAGVILIPPSPSRPFLAGTLFSNFNNGGRRPRKPRRRERSAEGKEEQFRLCQRGCCHRRFRDGGRGK